MKTNANISKRMRAAIIDYGLISSYMALMFYLYGEHHYQVGYRVSGWPGFSIMVVWFTITVGVEQITGATLGNHLQNLKPVPKVDSRQKLTFLQSLKRHLLDAIDIWPLGLIGILTIKYTKHHQRLGDIWAKTIVVDTSVVDQGDLQ